MVLKISWGYYPVGDVKFSGMHATADFALSAFKDAGFTDLSLDTFTPGGTPHYIFRFIKGRYNA